MFSLSLLSACSVQRIERATTATSVRDSSTVSNRETVKGTSRLDTVAVVFRDSVIYREKNDTIYIEKWHTRYQDRRVIVRDTFFNFISDTVVVLQTDTLSEKVIERKGVNAYYRFCSGGFWFLLLLMLGVAVFLFLRR